MLQKYLAIYADHDPFLHFNMLAAVSLLQKGENFFIFNPEVESLKLLLRYLKQEKQDPCLRDCSS